MSIEQNTREHKASVSAAVDATVAVLPMIASIFKSIDSVYGCTQNCARTRVVLSRQDVSTYVYRTVQQRNRV